MSRIRDKIARLEALRPELKCMPVPEHVLLEFERLHGLRLPDEYRRLLCEVGFGPGLMPFGEYLNVPFLQEVVGDPNRPFPHPEAWQLLPSFLDRAALDGVEEASEEMDTIYDEATARMEDAIWQDASILRTDGLIPIAELGCGEWAALITSGPDRGRVWLASADGGLSFSPVAPDGAERSGFDRWYGDYLDLLSRLQRHQP